MRRVVLTLLACAFIAGCRGGENDEPAKTDVVPTATIAALPTSTPNPLSVTPADWRQWTVDGIRFWLPQRYEGGEFGPSMDETLRRIAELGGNCVFASDQFRLLDRNDFMAVDSSRCAGGGALTSLTVNQETVSRDVSVREHIEKGVGLLPEGYESGGWEEVAIGDRDSGRVIVDFAPAGIKNVTYAMRAGDLVWWVSGIVADGDFDLVILELERASFIFEVALPEEPK